MNPANEATYNSFLCDDCRQSGFCLKRHEAVIAELLPTYYEVLSSPNPEYHYLKDNELCNLVPVKTMVKDFNTVSGKKLQQAHDLFHQEEYEQASYLYRDLLTQRADYDEAAIGLAACYFFMKQYEEAAGVASSINYIAFNKHLTSFLDACARVYQKPVIKQEELIPTRCFLENM